MESYNFISKNLMEN